MKREGDNKKQPPPMVSAVFVLFLVHKSVVLAMSREGRTFLGVERMFNRVVLAYHSY